MIVTGGEKALFGQQQVLVFKEKEEWLQAAKLLVLYRLSALVEKAGWQEEVLSETPTGLSVCPASRSLLD
jgi:hypothetical protein